MMYYIILKWRVSHTDSLVLCAKYPCLSPLYQSGSLIINLPPEKTITVTNLQT